MVDLERIAVEAFEKGKKETYKPQDPFVAFGFVSNPFLSTSMDELRNQPFIQSRVRLISHYIGKVYSSFSDNLENKKNSIEENILDGVLFGAAQSGISTFVQFTIKLLQEQLNLHYADARELTVFENEKHSVVKSIHNFRNYLGNYELDENSSTIVIVDHADYIIDFFEEFRVAFERDFQEIPVVFLFTYSGWANLKKKMKSSNYDLYNKTVQSYTLEHFNSSEIASILKMKLSVNGKVKKPFTNTIISHIAKMSGGNLNNSILISTNLCRECFLEGLDIATKKTVNEVCEKLEIETIPDFYDLITIKSAKEKTIKILSAIALRSVAHDVGITYDEIATELGIPKSSAFHYLKQFEAKGYITKDKIDRIAYYKLRDNFKTLADAFLLPKHEEIDVSNIKLETISELM